VAQPDRTPTIASKASLNEVELGIF